MRIFIEFFENFDFFSVKNIFFISRSDHFLYFGWTIFFYHAVAPS